MADVLPLPQHHHNHHLHLSAPSHSLDHRSQHKDTMAPSAIPAEATVDSIERVQNSIPEEPTSLPECSVNPPRSENVTPTTEEQVEKIIQKMKNPILGIDFTTPRPKSVKPSNQLLSLRIKDLHDEENDSSATNLVNGTCCGGGCCRLPSPAIAGLSGSPSLPSFAVPDNAAFKSLRLKLSPLSSRSRLSNITPLPLCTISIESAGSKEESTYESTAFYHPPQYVTPHPPYSVFSAKIDATRELTKPGAEKRTYHFDLDVTDYPEESEGVDFRVGGAIGVCAPNNFETVNDIFHLLGIEEKYRDAPVTLRTQGGRWPTIWGKEEARTLVTTRRELLTWTVDVQSYPPTKDLLRVLAEYATNEDEQTILLYLCAKQGQAAFCELRTGPYVTLAQLLTAFPSSKPPLDHLLCNLKTLMPRFYSLSNDPHESRFQHRRIVEIAVSVHESADEWRGKKRTGVGSGFFERCARKMIDEKLENVCIPMFRGLMANPLAKEFVADGPMLLIGAGVGIAPFRGFVQRRLQNANCANKVWVLQGVRDSLLDELYSGEWGVHEDKIRKVVESRVGTGRYVQEEVRAQADLVWFIINSLDGRVFVCGSSKGMGEGVEEALVDVVMEKGRLSRDEAKEFWKKKKEGMQYVAETW